MLLCMLWLRMNQSYITLIALLFSSLFLLTFSIRKLFSLLLWAAINWFSKCLDSNESISRSIESFIFSFIIFHNSLLFINHILQSSILLSNDLYLSNINHLKSRIILSYHNLHSSNINHIHQFRIILSIHNLYSWKMNHIHKIFNSSLKFLISIQFLYSNLSNKRKFIWLILVLKYYITNQCLRFLIIKNIQF